MNEQKDREYEIQCLLELLTVVINKEAIPAWRREPDWSKLYKLADYHHVANTIYGVLIGMEGKQLVKWKVRFEERFRFAVIMQERYQHAEKEVLSAMEKNKIRCMALQEIVLNRCYERAEYRNPVPIHLNVEKGNREAIDKAMRQLGFEKKAPKGKKLEPGESWYYRASNIYIVFYENLIFTRKKMSRYFSLPLQNFAKKKGFQYVYEQDAEDFYLYFLAYLTEKYARGAVEIRDVLDLWQYYLLYYEKIDWKAINKELKYLEIDLFADRIVKLAAMWFSKIGGFQEELPQLLAMESYILSKGTQAREENEKLLPLVREVANIYERDLKKERRKKQLQLWFPERAYMEAIYPVLEKTVLVIPFCWIDRLIKGQWRKLKYTIGQRMERIVQKKNSLIEGWKKKRKDRKDRKEGGHNS